MATTPHLIGAIRNFLLANTSLAEQLTGGIADGQVDRDEPAPYLVLASSDSTSLRLFGGLEIYTVTVTFSVFHTGRSTVESIANAIRDLILPVDDVAAWSPLGIAAGRRRLDRDRPGDPGRVRPGCVELQTSDHLDSCTGINACPSSTA